MLLLKKINFYARVKHFTTGRFLIKYLYFKQLKENYFS